MSKTLRYNISGSRSLSPNSKWFKLSLKLEIRSYLVSRRTKLFRIFFLSHSQNSRPSVHITVGSRRSSGFVFMGGGHHKDNMLSQGTTAPALGQHPCLDPNQLSQLGPSCLGLNQMSFPVLHPENRVCERRCRCDRVDSRANWSSLRTQDFNKVFKHQRMELVSRSWETWYWPLSADFWKPYNEGGADIHSILGLYFYSTKPTIFSHLKM